MLHRPGAIPAGGAPVASCRSSFCCLDALLDLQDGGDGGTSRPSRYCYQHAPSLWPAGETGEKAYET
eukprot:scaffold1866_cov277-Pinguiococcus_pyrenoidosus.AAC.2